MRTLAPVEPGTATRSPTDDARHAGRRLRGSLSSLGLELTPDIADSFGYDSRRTRPTLMSSEASRTVMPLSGWEMGNLQGEGSGVSENEPIPSHAPPPSRYGG